MMAGFGFPKKKAITERQQIYLKKKEIITLKRRYPAFGNLVPRDVASRAAKERCDAGYGVGTTKMAVYLDFADAIKRYGKIESMPVQVMRCAMPQPAASACRLLARPV